MTPSLADRLDELERLAKDADADYFSGLEMELAGVIIRAPAPDPTTKPFIAAFHPTSILELIAAIRAEMKDREWRPLRTCPSDGSLVWVYFPAWTGGFENREHEARLEERQADGDFWRNHLDHPPTYWMPKPFPKAPQP